MATSGAGLRNVRRAGVPTYYLSPGTRKRQRPCQNNCPKKAPLSLRWARAKCHALRPHHRYLFDGRDVFCVLWRALDFRYKRRTVKRAKLYFGTFLLSAFVLGGVAEAATVQTIDSAGRATGPAYALDDVRCRFDGNNLALVTGGAQSVQFLMTVSSFTVLPITTEWKGTLLGESSAAYFQDASGTRWRANAGSRCDVALKRDEKETRLDVRCARLVDADTVRPGLEHVVATSLACANAKLSPRP